MRYIKAASLVLYMSIWSGILLVSILMCESPILAYMGVCRPITGDAAPFDIVTLATDPLASIWNLIKSALTNWEFVALSFGLGLTASYFLGGLTGGGFSILYIIPLALVMGMMQLFLLPTQILLEPSVPFEIKTIYGLFIFALTSLTVMQFTAGRS